MKHEIAVIFLAVLVFPVGASALTVYSLEVGAFPTQQEASAYWQELSGRISPVFVEEIADSSPQPRWRVWVGHFRSEAEAWVYQSLLQKKEFPGCTIEPWLWDGRALEGNEYLPVERPFDAVVLREMPYDAQCMMDYETRGEPPQEAEAALDATSIEDLTAQELLYRGQWGSIEVAIPSLERLLTDYPQSPLVNQGRLRRAQLHLRAQEFDQVQTLLSVVQSSGTSAERSQAHLFSAYLTARSQGKDTPEALAAFRSVVNATETTPEDRLDAMLRTAALAKLAKDIPTSWLAYSQIEQAVDTPKLVAFARVNKAAIAFERFRRQGSGDWEEVRRLCEEAALVPGAPAEVRSTAELMYLETYFEEKNYAACLEAAQQFVETYAQVKREHAMALTWIALCQAMLGRKAEALATVEQIQQLDFEYPEHSFRGQNVKAIAAQWAAWLTQDDPSEHQRWVDLLLTEYPDTRQTQWVEAQSIESAT